MGSFWVSEKMASEPRASERRACSLLARERKIQDLLLATRSRSRFFDFFRTLVVVLMAEG